MSSDDDPLPSLLAALQPGRERPVPAAARAGVSRRFLRQGERVLLALEAERWTWGDPVLLVTDQCVLHLRRGVVPGWAQVREAAAGQVRSAALTPGPLSGTVRIAVRDDREIRVTSRDRALSQSFVDGVNALVAGNAR